ncbi:hypothetical protein [Novosphingobium rosa]|uniref:hypothetical protein n=1 Tax=Novosphingobium rosa TaxID=76978 RepID=UPI000AC90468|nr:hypothetical protein [Novosphingobium rosa]
MKVVDHEPHAWFLLEDEEALFLDAACNHSAFGYSWLIELNAEERQQFAEKGRPYIDWLAQDIHNGAPILEISQSPYKNRNRDRDLGPRVREAFKVWAEAKTP